MAGLQLEIIEPQENEEPATAKQMAFIRALCAEVGASFPADALKDLGKWQASALIEQLLEFKAELEGDEPLDTSRITGLDSDGGSSSTGISPTVSVVVILVVVVLVYLMVG